MPVRLQAPIPETLLPVAGVRLGIAQAGIRKSGRRDLLLIELAPGSAVAGVFTRNRFCAAPVQVCRSHLQTQPIRALLVNTGVANAGTGERGLEDARQSCAAVARLLDCPPAAVLPFSTGVIMEPLPLDRLVAALPACRADLAPDHWATAAEAIMTTDTCAKAASRKVSLGNTAITLTGIAKGAGMIHPDMATMLGFIATDATLAQPLLEQLVREVAELSFNAITVDGDTSTNDSFVVMATGQAGGPRIERPAGDDYARLKAALTDLATELAQAIVRDGEGASKFITIRVEGGRDVAECRAVGFAIAHSPLVKTAFFASDPNLGRILAAIGNAGLADLAADQVRLWLDAVLVAEKGGAAASYREADGARVMAQDEITVRVDLGRGAAQACVWTCDLSHDYVRINADYRS